MKHIYYNVKEPKMFHKKRLFFHFFLKSLLQHLLMGGAARAKKDKRKQKRGKRKTKERQKRDK